MRVLVYPHSMEIGGSQLNAVELAAAVRDRGHDVLLVAEDGPLVGTVRELGLEWLPLAGGARRRRPSAAVARQLVELVGARRVDVVHGYEWPPGVEAFFGPRRRSGTAVVCTVMSMSVAPFLPRSLPLVVGTADIRRRALAAGFRRVTLIEPPVDVTANSALLPAGDFRERYGLAPDVPLIVTACRLVPELKLEGLLAAVTAVGSVNAAGLACQLAIVGDGPARPLIAERAAAVNAAAVNAASVDTAAGRPLVVLTGTLDDPRPAYAAADLTLGMGGSALRGMAFGKPLVVQGERGFWETLTPESAGRFCEQGWYGVGDGQDGALALAGILRELLTDPARRRQLGDFARDLVVQRFSLQRAAAIQETVYAVALDGRTGRHHLDTARSAAGIAAYKVRRKLARLRGTARVDDFNAVTGTTWAGGVKR
ncbi:MAG: glycosyltransferase family 4 protein [Actinobacteria bacterium]|nr:glycosyltransferase family 4 protein [Actinomycetota bacterium]MBI3686316.1 glycosyltransferase family 4 protein [Actinomycetota bacterium]